MKKITDIDTLKNLPLTLQTMNYAENVQNKDALLKNLEFSVDLYQTDRTILKKFHRPISKML